jgi:hypothetical protein
MRVLFLTSDGQDNLEDSLLHGLRSLLGSNCIDYPKKKVLYRTYNERPPEQCYGRLFTLWKTLEDIQVDRLDIQRRLAAGEFSLVVVGAVHRTLGKYLELLEIAGRDRAVVIDGEDHSALAAQALRFLYFKRELNWKARLVWYRDERSTWRRIPIPTAPLRIEPISFSIPREKIVLEPLSAAQRNHRFQRHLVDTDVQAAVEANSSKVVADSTSSTISAARGYVHTSESEYYSDLQTSLFGVTMKRGGWDCLRHYEIGANGAILCFRHLVEKPRRCAPEGLDSSNSLSYRSASDLIRQTERLSVDEQDTLIQAAHRWAKTQTTEKKAEYFLDVVRCRLGVAR